MDALRHKPALLQSQLAVLALELLQVELWMQAHPGVGGENTAAMMREMIRAGTARRGCQGVLEEERTR